MNPNGGRPTGLLLACLVLTFGAQAAGAEAKKTAPAQPAAIEMHVGIRDLVYIGQTLDDVKKKFPKAESVPFGKQDDVITLKIAEAGISCIAVGEPGKLSVASVGFNLDAGTGLPETTYRTSKGIGKGSTVNDVLEAYGPPSEVLADQKPQSPLRRKPPVDSPEVPKMYQYHREDGRVTTYFLIENHMVTRIVVNELAPLDEHIIKKNATK